MTSGRLSLAARAYARCLWLMPPSVRQSDGDEMVWAFANLWREREGALGKLRLAARLFGRLPMAAALEWVDVLEITGYWGGWGMTGWVGNLRFAVRALRKAPAFTLTTLFLIGLGVGAVTTIFSIVDHVLLRPLPYPEAGRLITVDNGSHSGLIVKALEDFNSVEEWAAGASAAANLVGEGNPLRIEQATVSRSFFALFGGRPARGRLLVEDDFNAADAIVVSYATWANVFGSDPELVGRTIRIDGEPVVVVGVLHKGFEPPQQVVAARVDVWRPIDWSSEDALSPQFHVLEVAGRMRPGATPVDVQAELDALAVRMAELYPEDMVTRDGDPESLPVRGLQDATVQRVQTGLSLLLAAVGLLLLVACLNVAHLFLARGLGRAQEMAVRRALGAGAGAVFRQLLAESLVIGMAGGALGLGLAQIGLKAFLMLNPGSLPRSTAVTLDPRVLIFAIVVSVGTAIAFGLLPALRSVGGDLAGGLKASSRGLTTGRRTARLRSILVVGEVAISLVLVAEAGLLLQSFARMQSYEPGFDPRGVWTLPLTPTGIDTPADYATAMDAVEASLAAVPGVEVATYGLTQPFQFVGSSRCCWNSSGITVDGEERDGLRITMQPVTASYFETLRIPMLSGSTWTESEEAESPTPTVISERLAISLFGSINRAVGRVLGDPERQQWRVSGVAGDTKHYGLDQPAPEAIFLPITAIPFSIPMAHMAVRFRGEVPEGVGRTLREAVWRAAPDMPVPTVRSMDEWVEASMGGRRFDSALFGAFGVIALILAAAGLSGTLLYNVRSQRRELGIRLALGAERSRIERDVVSHGVRLALYGSAIGLVGAWSVGRFLESRLFEVDGNDPVTLLLAVAVLLVTATLASWLPARRAGRTDPLETLKAE
jgi:putative ABC transport system permease protein